ncbi:MutS-related protein [Aridibaculum aurantiacum]|uniref:MutS-related protein n=1 Tax=Aridibaculum aurantiacum TaxID=2810307 RepID=UPI001A973125|nr:DNA mismatch repair protein MutS [Aridibaculum aurantiacum]
MQADKTTINDLSIFHHEEEQSVFHHINFTTSTGGKEWMRYLLSHPLNDLNKIKQTQQLLQLIIKHADNWPTIITNGTVMVVERFYDTGIEDIPQHPNVVNATLYKLFNAHDYSLVKYSVNHFIDFCIGLGQLIRLFEQDEQPTILAHLLDQVRHLTNKPVIQTMMQWDKKDQPTHAQMLTFGRFLRRFFKAEALELVDIYSRLDAYYGMAMACKKFNFTFPQIEKSAAPYIEATNLYHLLLHEPVSYNVELNQQTNFLFLTGANMAGKSTFIKAVGVSVYMAHIGMGVPADSFQVSYFDGLLSNIQVEDNITRGESYFFNEVQRIKKTITKINDGRHWLILIDELFKGTNVQDAMKCSTAVIEGLRKMKNTLFILSTHLYEIGEGLKQYPNIKFNYFETHVKEGQLEFSYQLQQGISNDRLGYLILQREGVVDMLERL